MILLLDLFRRLWLLMIVFVAWAEAYYHYNPNNNKKNKNYNINDNIDNKRQTSSIVLLGLRGGSSQETQNTEYHHHHHRRRLPLQPPPPPPRSPMQTKQTLQPSTSKRPPEINHNNLSQNDNNNNNDNNYISKNIMAQRIPLNRATKSSQPTTHQSLHPNVFENKNSMQQQQIKNHHHHGTNSRHAPIVPPPPWPPLSNSSPRILQSQTRAIKHQTKQILRPESPPPPPPLPPKFSSSQSLNRPTKHSQQATSKHSTSSRSNNTKLQSPPPPQVPKVGLTPMATKTTKPTPSTTQQYPQLDKQQATQQDEINQQMHDYLDTKSDQQEQHQHQQTSSLLSHSKSSSLSSSSSSFLNQHVMSSLLQHLEEKERQERKEVENRVLSLLLQAIEQNDNDNTTDCNVFMLLDDRNGEFRPKMFLEEQQANKVKEESAEMEMMSAKSRSDGLNEIPPNESSIDEVKLSEETMEDEANNNDTTEQDAQQPDFVQWREIQQLSGWDVFEEKIHPKSSEARDDEELEEQKQDEQVEEPKERDPLEFLDVTNPLCSKQFLALCIFATKYYLPSFIPFLIISPFQKGTATKSPNLEDTTTLQELQADEDKNNVNGEVDDTNIAVQLQGEEQPQENTVAPRLKQVKRYRRITKTRRVPRRTILSDVNEDNLEAIVGDELFDELISQVSLPMYIDEEYSDEESYYDWEEEDDDEVEVEAEVGNYNINEEINDDGDYSDYYDDEDLENESDDNLNGSESNQGEHGNEKDLNDFVVHKKMVVEKDDFGPIPIFWVDMDGDYSQLVSILQEHTLPMKQQSKRYIVGVKYDPEQIMEKNLEKEAVVDGFEDDMDDILNDDDLRILKESNVDGMLWNDESDEDDDDEQMLDKEDLEILAESNVKRNDYLLFDTDKDDYTQGVESDDEESTYQKKLYVVATEKVIVGGSKLIYTGGRKLFTALWNVSSSMIKAQKAKALDKAQSSLAGNSTTAEINAISNTTKTGNNAEQTEPHNTSHTDNGALESKKEVDGRNADGVHDNGKRDDGEEEHDDDEEDDDMSLGESAVSEFRNHHPTDMRPRPENYNNYGFRPPPPPPPPPLPRSFNPNSSKAYLAPGKIANDKDSSIYVSERGSRSPSLLTPPSSSSSSSSRSFSTYGEFQRAVRRRDVPNQVTKNNNINPNGMPRAIPPNDYYDYYNPDNQKVMDHYDPQHHHMWDPVEAWSDPMVPPPPLP